MSILQFGLFELLGILSDNEVIDAVLDIAVHKGGQVVDCVADAVVGNASLRIVVGTDFG